MFYVWMQYSIIFCSLQEVANNVMSGKYVRQIVLIKNVNFGYSELHQYWKIQLKDVGGGIWTRLSQTFDQN